MEVKPLQPNEKNESKMPQKPQIGNPRMPMNMNNHHSKGGKPGGNFTKPMRTMRASKGR